VTDGGPESPPAPRWPSAPASPRMWLVLVAMAVVAATVSGSVYLRHAGDFFLSDDLELIANTIEGSSLFEPISTHIRPVVRLHFLLLYRAVPSHIAFGMASLTLHLVSCLAFFLVADALYGRRVGILAALAQFACFLGSGAVFWAAAVGVIYCLLFSALSLFAFVRGRLVTSTLLLALAAGSYELWLAVPVLMLLLARRARDLIIPWVMAVAYVAANMAMFGLLPGESYGGFVWSELPVRFATSAFRLVSPFSGEPAAWMGVVLMAALAAVGASPRFRVPVLAYATTVLLLSPSADFAGRFQYIPGAALILVAILGLASRPCAAVPAATALAGLLILSPVVVWLDGEDYGRLAAMHEEIFRTIDDQLSMVPSGRFVIIDNRLGPEGLLEYSTSLRGSPKVVFVRESGIGGMVLPRTLAVILLDRRGLAPQGSACRGTRIQIGEGPPRSHYCFRIRR
jgi:hypothetical protein